MARLERSEPMAQHRIRGINIVSDVGALFPVAHDRLLGIDSWRSDPLLAAGCRQSYPLRPELMESSFMLYEATGDERYREAARKLQERLLKKNKVACGFAGVSDVTTGGPTQIYCVSSQKR